MLNTPNRTCKQASSIVSSESANNFTFSGRHRPNCAARLVITKRGAKISNVTRIVEQAGGRVQSGGLGQGGRRVIARFMARQDEVAGLQKRMDG